ncbi:MAG: molecular chaperone DnaJ, partial [Alphaproteobacteria bacterium]|nr:molecular chaperone DnaJ [Alphaproteobacteria bacterium]
MIDVVLGALVLAAFLILGRLFVGADPRALARGLRVTGATLLGLAAVALLSLDRVGLGSILGSMAWGLYTGGHLWPRGWPYYGGRRTQWTPPPAGGQTTAVRTDWLVVELDHGTGAMRGRVLKGRYKGQALERLSQAAAVALYREAADDAETARLLEAYLDRTYGAAWRKPSDESQSRSESGRRRSRDGGMSREEAFAVLGLQPGASEDEIRTAHRKLM